MDIRSFFTKISSVFSSMKEKFTKKNKVQLFFNISGLLVFSTFIFIGASSLFAGNLSAPNAISDSVVTDGQLKTITLVQDNTETTYKTTTSTVNDFLKENNVTVGFSETTFPASNCSLQDDMKVLVGQKTLSTDTKVESIPFSKEKVKDFSIPEGKEVVKSAGADGQKNVTYLVEKIGDYEISRVNFSDSVIEEPVSEVVKVGYTAADFDLSDLPELKETARELCAQRGWGDVEFECLDLLWTKESNWNPNAENSSSGAYGIPQALPGSKMAAFGSDWRTNPVTQIKWGLDYIAGRYGTPSSAWAHSCSTGWY